MEQKEQSKKIPDNVVFIGLKPFMNYIQAVQRQFQDHNEILIKARGRNNIGKAVNIEEAIRKKFLKEENIEVAGVKLDSEKFEPKENNKNHKKVNVSSIEIKIIKKSKDL